MSSLATAFNTCCSAITSQWGGGGTRQTLIVTPNLVLPSNCCVYDVVEFPGNGQLIFPLQQTTDRDQPSVCALICRQLIVKGGSAPSQTGPCKPGDPGTQYANTNAITWMGRLTSPPTASTVSPPKAAAGPAGSGATGSPGSQGNPGQGGNSIGGATLIVVALEVDYTSNSRLIVDWAGQNGGTGGPGQDGGTGGSGKHGTNFVEGGWPGYGCSQPPGNGGDGGPGGTGGQGGTGGPGGVAGKVGFVGTTEGLTFFQHQATIVPSSNGGGGGSGGKGGTGGAGGDAGAVGVCSQAASKGNQGGSGPVGSAGGAGAPGSNVTLLPVETLSGGASNLQTTCAVKPDAMPVALVFSSGNPTPTFYRCFSGGKTGSLTLAGQYLDQIASVATNLTGVNVTVDSSSTDTSLVLHFSILANSQAGAGNLTFNYFFQGGTLASQTLANAYTVEVWGMLTSITPNHAAQGSTTAMTLNGTGFDPSAAYHGIEVGGPADVTITNVSVISDTQIQCTFAITANAATTARSVTVLVGSSSTDNCGYTLSGAFTIT